MIYFDENKKAYMQYIDNYICVIPDKIWLSFGLNAQVGVDYDINLKTGQFIDLRTTPEYMQEQLIKAKNEKLNENKTKLNAKRYGQSFTVTLQDKECEFDTSEQTQSDLQTAAIVTSTGATYDNWVTNNGVTLDLTGMDIQIIFANFFPLVSPLYSKDLIYKEQINNATTIEEVNAIIIEY